MGGKTPKGVRYGGRAKGTPNKKSSELLDRALAMGLDPWEALCDLAKNGPPDLKYKALTEVCQYVYPKRKAIEVTGAEGGPAIVVKVEDYTSK